MRTRAIGIDLAWGERATTAAVVLEEGRVIDWDEALTDDNAILAFVARNDEGGPLCVGIDAPTCVPNTTGRRPCDALLSSALRRYEAGPHPANRTLLARADGTIRGERLVAALATRGIVHTTDSRNTPRTSVEVYPHPAHVALFRLAKTLKYKRKAGRSTMDCCAELKHYAELLATLPIILPEWAKRDPEALRPGARKRHEDALDALTCAYVAQLHLDQRTLVVGDCQHGHIVVPSTEEFRQLFANVAP